MAKYTIRYADTFFKAMDKLDRPVQKQIAAWIDKHLENVDFPTVLGKHLTADLGECVRFRVGSYRVIALVGEGDFVITNLYVAKREIVYKFKRKKD